MTMTYSRDSAARPLAILSHVLKEIRDGQFEPDCTRSGRLKPGAASLDHVDMVGVVPVVSASHLDGATVATDAAEPATASETVDAGTGIDVQGPEASQEGEGHLTTDSSDSSGEEIAAWAPVIGHYAVEIPADKKLWLNSNTKMFHLSHDENVHILLCGRRISANFHRNESQVRFDSAKCRQCFRLKDSSR